jgi:Secretion system C-terminal sorting domain
MKKILLISGLLFGFFAKAQTIVFPNYNGNLVKDVNNQFVYSESFNSGTNAYTLNKIDDEGIVTPFLSYTFSTTTQQVSNNGGSGYSVFYNRRNPTYVKGNKAIVRFMQGTTAAHLLYDGTTTSVFTIPNSSMVNSIYSDFIINDNNAIIYDYTRIYETDYTSSGTNLIFTSPNPKNSFIEFLEVLQNDGGLYWIDVYNFSKTLYKRVGGVTTELLTVTGGDSFHMYQNKINNEIYITNRTSITADKKLIKIDNVGNHTFLTSPAEAFLSSAYGLVNNKLIFQRFSGQLIALDLTSNTIADITNTADISMGLHKMVTTTDGSKGYFLSFSATDQNSAQYPYFTDGIIVTPLGGSVGTTNINAGDFCGDNFYFKKASNPTTFFSEIALLTPTSSSTYFPGSPTNTSYEVGVSNATGIYIKAQQSVSPFGAPLYKTTCNNALAISESAKLNFDISIYPNPTTGNFNIAIDENLIGAEVTVYNVLGQKVKNFSLENVSTNQNLEAGMYILEIEKEGNKTSKKLIVN